MSIHKILILEDNATDADLIKLSLRNFKMNFEAVHATGKKEFTAALDQFSFDIILSDHSLPQYSSFEALDEVKRRGFEIPFILVTGAVSEEFAVDILKRGADDYILKSNLTRLPSAITQALEKWHIKLGKQKAEMELIAEHERVLFHIENGPLGYIELDGYLRVKSWSKRAEKIFGWSEGEFKAGKKDVFCLVYEEDLPKVKGLTEKLISGEIDGVNVQNRNNTKDGRVIWCEWFNSVTRNSDGKLDTVFLLVQDISERKKMEQIQKESEEKYRYLFNYSPMPKWIYDVETFKFLEVNEAAVNHYGYSRADFLNKTILDIRPKEDVEAVKKMNRRPHNSTPQHFGEWRHIKANGDIIDVDISGHKIEFNNRKALMIISNDITERKKTESEIENRSKQLRELTAHLQNIREEERKRIGREIHDDLGQQLTAIKMDIAWIDKKITGESAAIKSKLKNIIALLDSSNESVRRILNELRSDILENYGLTEALEWQANQFTTNTGIPLSFSCPEADLKPEESVATCIFRSFQEALTNITRYAEAQQVISSLSCINNTIVFIIEDDGKGFNIPELNNKKSFGILGMKERVASVNGKFKLISAPGKGTKLIITIPYTDIIPKISSENETHHFSR